ncbi:MAG: hypothetical protein WDW38_003281 [Sanguina aurantia]
MPVHPVPASGQPGVYYLDGQTWQVGSRYTLLRLLGQGSFSSVCLAVDHQQQTQVALKRIGDVLSSPENAKRVLREVCILRRLSHPNIISVSHVFMTPAATGRLLYRGGKLVNMSVDIYMALEYCEAGDLFNMRGQLPEDDAKQLLWQLLSALRYMHGQDVWHRDIKSANVLVTVRDGQRVAKIADFGSARSAVVTPSEHPFEACATFDEGDIPSCPSRSSLHGGTGEQEPEEGGRHSAQGSRHDPQPGMHVSDSMRQMDLGGGDSHSSPALPTSAPDEKGQFKQPLTRVVCTPCYRAPEVILSRGGYTSAIDSWSVGCVFGELLQRVYRLSQSAIPHLQVAPVFAISGLPLTPTEGDHFEGPGCANTHAELHALFSVIGTPSWACIASVQSDIWRSYLFHIPGRAPTLFRRFGGAGEPAVDLLSRLLTFDPARRCSIEEALMHEYFDDTRPLLAMQGPQLQPLDISSIQVPGLQQKGTAHTSQHSDSSPGAKRPCTRGHGAHVKTAVRFYEIQDAAAALAALEEELSALVCATSGDDVCEQLKEMLQKECDDLDCEQQAATARLTAQLSNIQETLLLAAEGQNSMGRLLESCGGCSDGSGSLTPGSPMLTAFGSTIGAECRSLSDPSQALSWARHAKDCDPASILNSHSILDLDSRSGSGRGRRSPRDGRSGAGDAPTVAGSGGVGRVGGGTGSAVGKTVLYEVLRRTSPMPRTDSPKLDPGPHIDASMAGWERISNPMECNHHSAGEHLQPEKHLKAGRHGEWALMPLRGGPKSGAVWGVSIYPPGVTEANADPALLDIIRHQHAR